jgi:hypothetical protein
MNIDPVPKMSSLCQSLTRDDHTVEIEIYQGDPGKWILEVVDENGNSTVWDDQFDTDQQALDEVHKTVTEEGIESIIGSPPSPTVN